MISQLRSKLDLMLIEGYSRDDFVPLRIRRESYSVLVENYHKYNNNIAIAASYCILDGYFSEIFNSTYTSTNKLGKIVATLDIHEIENRITVPKLNTKMPVIADMLGNSAVVFVEYDVNNFLSSIARDMWLDKSIVASIMIIASKYPNSLILREFSRLQMDRYKTSILSALRVRGNISDKLFNIFGIHDDSVVKYWKVRKFPKRGVEIMESACSSMSIDTTELMNRIALAGMSTSVSKTPIGDEFLTLRVKNINKSVINIIKKLASCSKMSIGEYIFSVLNQCF